jgi:cytochrome c553
MSRAAWSAGLLLAATCGFCIAGTTITPRQANEFASACNSCHWSGAAGPGIPRLDNMPESQIVQDMRDYRVGKRKSQIMHVVANGLTEQEIEAVAHFLAAPPSPAGQ